MEQPRKKGRFASKKQIKRTEIVRQSQLTRWGGKQGEEFVNSTRAQSFQDDFISDDILSTPEVVYSENTRECPRLETDWRCGRRIVELGVLADALSACKKCGLPLQLSHCTGITTHGLSAMLKIPCSNTVCKYLNTIPTGKRHDDRVWDVNRKLAAAVQHTGVGYTQINGILAELNIPPISKTLLYTRQEEVGQATESVASSSINDALQEEVEATTKNKQSTSITVSVDGAWQKRGSGRSYDSLTGHCSMIGSQTGKIVGYSVRNKFCRQCDNATERNQLPPPHNCKRNWTGSSKSMEPDMNQGNPDGIEKGLLALSLHPFGNHIECSEVWCQHKRNPTTSKYSSLPYGKPLKGEVLQQDLENTFHKLKKHSTASVAQKNMGESYLIQVNKRLGLSPGTYTRRLAAQKDLAARRKRALAVTSKAKKRRLHLRAKRNQTAASRETREPVNYCPQVAPNDNEESLGTAVEIPPPITRPAPEPAEFSKENNPFIYFDLESTGLARNSHITQIAAVCGNEKFSQYVMPKVPMTSKAAEVTGIDVINGKMYCHGNEVNAVKLSAAADALLNFFMKFQSKVVLIGHNIKSFDCHLLLNALESCSKTDAFLHCIAGFVDTRLLFKIFNPNLKSFSQESLFEQFVFSNYNAHDALEDVLALRTLVQTVDIDVASVQFLSASFTFSNALGNYLYCLQIQQNLPSLGHLVDERVITKNMANKIAGSGLNLKFLQLAYSRNPSEGILNLFSEPIVSNRVRVTKSQKVIASLKKYFASNVES
uniref:Exonuclease domain-containing protein n=1 Tax=Magallana gigas TaxID=29159 RepID=A0A8W8P2F2_MAGGI